MKFLALLNFAASLQGLFLSYLLINKNGDSKSHRSLALLVLTLSVSILGPVLGLSGFYRDYPHLVRIGEPMAFLYGPFLFFYICQLTNGALPKLYWLHLTPFLIYLAFLVPFYDQHGNEKIAYVDNILQGNDNNLFQQTIRMIHIILYVFLSLKLIREFQSHIKENFSDIEQLNLDKADLILKSFLGITGLGMLVYLAGLLFDFNFILVNNLIAISISIAIYALAYASYDRPVIQAALPDTPNVQEEPKEKNRNTYNLSQELYEESSQKLEYHLVHEKVYLINDLSLQSLSHKLGLQPYQVSELIHRKYQQTFFDLINRYRIEEVKARLNDPAFDHYSILGLAMENGFNSKSSFNTAFKKFTGFTPSAYKKQQVSASTTS